MAASPIVCDGGEPADPVVSCEFRGGTLSVFEDHVRIDRSKRSMFEDKRIRMDEIHGVNHSNGFVTGHLQIEQIGIEPDSAGFLSHPVDENTLHFPRTKRDCAAEARDAILARASGEPPAAQA